MPTESYDVILLGTGLTECILSGVLASLGYRVLHLDRNPFYGGESASLNLDEIFAKFGRDRSQSTLAAENPHHYNLDVIPKVLLAAGEIVQLMEKTIIHRYHIETSILDGSFLMRDGQCHKVPADPSEALRSGLMGFFEKRRVAKFLGMCKRYSSDDPIHHSMKFVFDDYGLSDGSIEFIGHAVALHDNDAYLEKPAHDTLLSCQLYNRSLEVYGGSPYMYPHYGMGEIPAYFARLGAVHGGVYSLDATITRMSVDALENVQSIDFTVSDESYTATAQWVIGDPSYFPDFSHNTHTILRCVCVTDVSLQSSAESMQIILPSTELKRANDVFVLQLSHEQHVVPAGKYAVFVSTVLEPDESPEVLARVVLSMLECNPLEIFVGTQPYSEEKSRQNVLVTSTPNSASHFEASGKDVEAILEKICGKRLAEIFPGE